MDAKPKYVKKILQKPPKKNFKMVSLSVSRPRHAAAFVHVPGRAV
jgi:hypothetical protein